MATMQPRLQAPGTVARGDLFQVRMLATHAMETGLRHDETGRLVPRHIINTVTCRYNGAVVFRADLREAIAANPYLSFYVRAAESGHLQVTWEEDGGAAVTLEKPLMVEP